MKNSFTKQNAIHLTFEVYYEDAITAGTVEIPADFYPNEGYILFSVRRAHVHLEDFIRIKVDHSLQDTKFDNNVVHFIGYSKNDLLKAFDVYAVTCKIRLKNSSDGFLPNQIDYTEVEIKAQDQDDSEWYPLDSVFIGNNSIIPIYSEPI